jgi:cysteine desulfurase
MRRVYFDHHAATPLDPRVHKALLELGDSVWANPSSVHAEGRRSRALIERAREQIAQAIDGAPADIVLTSGGTEACNLGVLALHALRPGAHIVTTPIEHPAVSEPIAQLERSGRARVTRLAIPAGRAPEPAELAALIGPDTAFCALQWVNHELGTLLPIEAYARVCRSAGVPLFVDATQALGKLPISVRDLDVDLLALASHKIGGPAGAGALWVKRGLDLAPLVRGGGQERGRRAGTPDVRSLVGFGFASELVAERVAAMPRTAALRDRLEAALLQLGAVRNAPAGARVATASNVYWPGRRSDVMVSALDIEGVAVSAGAACSSGKSEPSPVLLAVHPDERPRAEASTRFSIGPEVSETDVDFVLECCARVVARPAV